MQLKKKITQQFQLILKGVLYTLRKKKQYVHDTITFSITFISH